MKHFVVLFFLLTSWVFATVNLNTANEVELSKLKGIGPAKAKAIIEYRTKNNGFKKPEDLMIVKGIGPKIYDALKNEVTVK